MGHSLLVDHNEGSQDVNDLDSLGIGVRGGGRLNGDLLETVSRSPSLRVAYRELAVEAGDGGGDVAEALGNLLWPMSGHPGDLELGLRYTHEAADREVQDVQVADDRAEGGRRGRKRLDGGDDHVGALGHGADRAEEDDGDKRDELAEELHGEMRIGGCWEAALKSFVGLLSS